MSEWVPAPLVPMKSGYYVCWCATYHRPHVAWFDANKRRFESKRHWTHWAEVTPPKEGGGR